MKRRLADVAEVRTGYPFRGKVLDDPRGTLAVVQMKDVSSVGQLHTDNYLHIKEEPAHGRHLLQLGDVLLQSRGSNYPAGAVVDQVHGIAALGLHVLRPGKEVLPEYLAWVMNHPTTRGSLREIARGSYIPFLSKTDLVDFLIPVPPIPTQQRIVNVARLEREAARLESELQSLRDQYTAAISWHVVNHIKSKHHD
jgi:hypothetical protein